MIPVLTKTEAVAASLEEDIRAGTFEEGERLPSFRTLAHAHGVSTMVLVGAVRQLEEKGLVKTRERSGVFVSQSAEKLLKRFGLFTQVRQGSMDKYYDTLMDAAARNNALAVPVTPPDSHDGWLTELRKLMGLSSYRIALDLDGKMMTFQQLASVIPAEQILFFNRFEWVDATPVSAVLADYTRMTQRTLEYLLAKGYKKIVFLGHKPEPLPFKRAQLEAAGKAVGLAFGSPRFDYCSYTDFEFNTDRLSRIFAGKNCPDAIISRSDAIMFKFMSQAHIVFPMTKQMEKIGCHNTFWSRIPGQEFSTWQLDFETMWDRAMLKTETDVEYVLPRFIERSTSVT